jgi:hypothetical protein
MHDEVEINMRNYMDFIALIKPKMEQYSNFGVH